MSRQELGVVSPPEAVEIKDQSRSEAQKRWWRTHPDAEERRAEIKNAGKILSTEP